MAICYSTSSPSEIALLDSDGGLVLQRVSGFVGVKVMSTMNRGRCAPNHAMKLKGKWEIMT